VRPGSRSKVWVLLVLTQTQEGWADIWRGGPPGLASGCVLFLALPALNPDFLYAALDATAYAAFFTESRIRSFG
jgi:hypothetical protein